MRFTRKMRFKKEEVFEILEVLDDYIWIAIDVKRGVICGGDELIAILKRDLLALGSKIYDIYGVGLDLITGEIDYYSSINIKRIVPDSTREVPMEKRERIETLINYFFEELLVRKESCQQGRYVRYEQVTV